MKPKTKAKKKKTSSRREWFVQIQFVQNVEFAIATVFFMSCVVVALSISVSVLKKVRFVYAEATSPWVQTDWSGGVGVSTSTQFSTSSNALVSTVGQIEVSTSSGWYNANWSNRKKITIDSSMVSSTLTDFPVLITEANLGSDFFAAVKSDGTDIVFTSSDGTTKLSREVVDIDTGGETLESWVKIPSLSDSADTDIYIYYGYASASETNDESTWNSNYYMVQHLNEDPADAAPEYKDSTDNSTDGTDQDGTNTTSTAQIGAGAEFGKDGDTNNIITLGPDQNALNTVVQGADKQFTLSTWVKPTANETGTNYVVMSNEPGATACGAQTYGWRLYLNNDRPFLYMYKNATWSAGRQYGYGSAGSINDLSKWTLLTVTYDGTVDDALADGRFKFFVDGAAVDTGSWATGVFDVTYPGYAQYSVLGGKAHTSGVGCTDQHFSGGIDESRAVTAIMTQQWILTEYNNQNDPSTFYSVSSEEAYLATTGTLTSAIFDTEQASAWGTLTYTTDVSASTTVKVRTSDDSGMSGATDFSSCAAIANAADMSADSCVTDGERYIQYQVTLTTDGVTSPVFSDISLAFGASNAAPTVDSLSVTSTKDGTGGVSITTQVDDGDNDEVRLKIEYLSGTCATYSGQTTSSLSSTVTAAYGQGDITVDNNDANGYQVNVVTTTPGANTVTTTWNSATDAPSADGQYCIFVTANDSSVDSTVVSTTVTLDNVSPVAPGDLTFSSRTTSSLVYAFGATSTDTNFDEYIMYYTTGAAVSATGTAFTSTSDTNLASQTYGSAATTTISSLSVNTQYTTNIWALDTYINSTTASTSVTAYTAANAPATPTVALGSVVVTINQNSNPANTEYALCRTTDGTTCVSSGYVQTDASFDTAAAWQTYASWGGASGVTITAVDPNTAYQFIVKARNGDNVETSFSSANTALYTTANVPATISTSISSLSATVTWVANSNPAGTAYYVEEINNAALNSGWITDLTYTFTGLNANTNYTFRVKARNGDSVETAFVTDSVATTNPVATTPSTGGARRLPSNAQAQTPEVEQEIRPDTVEEIEEEEVEETEMVEEEETQHDESEQETQAQEIDAYELGLEEIVDSFIGEVGDFVNSANNSQGGNSRGPAAGGTPEVPSVYSVRTPPLDDSNEALPVFVGDASEPDTSSVADSLVTVEEQLTAIEFPRRLIEKIFQFFGALFGRS